MTQDQRLGFFCGMGAYLIWGFLPLYLALLRHIDAADVLAYRVLWSVPTAAIMLTIGARWGEFWNALRNPKTLWLLLTSVLIGTNWLIFIWAVGQERVMEASLGYFINPLVNVAVASIFLSERLRRWQWVAVGLALIAVIIETLALGRPPWIALVLAGTFSAYGIIRRKLVIDARVGFTIEVMLIVPLALIWFGMALSQGRNVAGNGVWDLALLSLSGPFTAIPLLLFALAAKRLRFSTIGIMQYLGPSLQFMVALALGETLSLTRMITFLLIWAGVLIFSLDAFGEDWRQRRLLRQAPPV